MGLDSKLMFRCPPPPLRKVKAIPAFAVETRIGGSDWIRARDCRLSKDSAIREAGRTARKLLEAGYEPSIRLVQDGTIEVRDYL